jgi:hypothetical protein
MAKLVIQLLCGDVVGQVADIERSARGIIAHLKMIGEGGSGGLAAAFDCQRAV